MSSPLLGPKHVALLLEKMTGLVEAVVTVDGEHVVTAARVREDLVEAISTAGGRTSSASLATVIGIDEAMLQGVIRSFWTKELHGRCFERGDKSTEVLSNAYLASLACEAAATAERLGRVTLRELASTFDLPLELTEVLVSGWMRGDQEPLSLVASGSRLVNGALVTEAYEATKRAALRSVCCAATEPRSMEDLMRACDLHPEENELAFGLLQGLIESGEVRGTLTAGEHARAYLPESFVAGQHEAAYAFFSANGYLDNTTASELQVRKLHAFVKDRHPDAVCLETAVVGRVLVDQLEVLADAAVAEASWFEAWTVVPTILSDADATRLVGMCAACNRADEDPTRVLQLGVYGVSSRFIQDVVARFHEDAASALDSTAPSSGARPSERGQPRGSGASSRKRGVKQRRRGGTKKGGGDADLGIDEARLFLSACRPELQDHHRLVAALGAHLAPVFLGAKAEAKRRAEEASGADSFQGRVEAFETIFERCYATFQLHCRGVQTLRQYLLRQQPRSEPAVRDPCLDPDAATTSDSGASSEPSETFDSEGRRAEAYLLRTLGAQLAELLTARECEKLGIPFACQDGGDARQPEERMPVISQDASSALVEVLPSDVASSLAHLWHAAMFGDQLSTFCEILEQQVFPACSLVGRRLDKRSERQLVAARQRVLKENLFRSVSEQDVLHFAALLVFLSVTGGIPLLPPPVPLNSKKVGRDLQFSWVGMLLIAVRYDLPPEEEECLSSLQKEIEGCESTVASADDALDDGRGLVDGPREDGSAVAREYHGGQPLRLAAGAIDKRARSGETAAARLMRLTEAARELGMACSV